MYKDVLWDLLLLLGERRQKDISTGAKLELFFLFDIYT